jgi:hypothetical protein
MMSYDLFCYGRTILILIVYEHGVILTRGECRSWAEVRGKVRGATLIQLVRGRGLGIGMVPGDMGMRLYLPDWE